MAVTCFGARARGLACVGPATLVLAALAACSSPGGGAGFPAVDGVVFGDGQPADTGLPPDAALCDAASACPAATPYCGPGGACAACVSDGHCPDGGRCANGACLAAACTPNEAACDGSVLLTCKLDGSGWNTLPCDGACRDGACVGCDPGDRVCNGTTVMACKDDGTTFEAIEQCLAGQTCADGQCFDCYPGQRRCSAAGAAESCSLAGHWEVTQDCTSAGLSCLLGTCVSPCVRDPKSKSNSGCDYWAVDVDNHPAAQGSVYAVIVSNLSEQKATVTVTKKDSAGVQAAQVLTREVVPGGLEILELPQRNMGSAGIWWTAYRLESTVPIVAYQFNPLENVNVFSNDATMLLPANALGTDYIAVSRFQFVSGAPNDPNPYRGWIAVVAPSTGTDVTVTPSIRTQAGTSMATMSAGQTYTYALEPYQVLNIKSDQDQGDLTGTIIHATRPVGVFGGHEAAITGTQCCADHLEQQLFPVATWGTSYIATKSYPRLAESDYWRVVAAEDDTHVSFNPAVSTNVTLGRGKWVEVQSPSDFVITADKPIEVAQYIASSLEIVKPPEYTPCASEADCYLPYVCVSAGGVSGCSPPACTSDAQCPQSHVCTLFPNGKRQCRPIGDPAMIMIPPAKQFRNDYVFLTPNKYAHDYVNIIAPSDASVTLDGNLLGAVSFAAIAGSDWKVSRLEVGDGVHKIVANKPVGVVVYGYDRDVGYGYAGGLNLVDN